MNSNFMLIKEPVWKEVFNNKKKTTELLTYPVKIGYSQFCRYK